MNNRVTVLIPFYNSGCFLKEAIESVFKQTYKKWNIILIDDCSTDKYLDEIKSYLSDERVTLIKNMKNLGQSKSLNAGLELVNTPFVVQLDADDLFYEDTLEIMIKEALLQSEKVGLICGNTMVFQDKKGKKKNIRIKKGSGFKGRYEFLIANLSMAPRFYRTTALKEIGGWPTDDPFGGRYREDMRVMYKLIENYHFHWIDRELYKHRRHNSNLTKNLDECIEMVEWSIKDTLKRWGDEYEPIFRNTSDGWKQLHRLKKKKIR